MQCATIYSIIPIEIKFWCNSGFIIGMTDRFSFFTQLAQVPSIFKSNNNKNKNSRHCWKTLFSYRSLLFKVTTIKIRIQRHCWETPPPPNPKKNYMYGLHRASPRIILNLILLYSQMQCILTIFFLDICPPTIPLSQITYRKDNMSSQIWGRV